MNLLKNKIIALLVAGLTLAACIAAVYFTITLTNGPLIGESALKPDLAPSPMRLYAPPMPAERPSGVSVLAGSPFADRVPLAIIPGAAKPPSASPSASQQPSPSSVAAKLSAPHALDLPPLVELTPRPKAKAKAANVDDLTTIAIAGAPADLPAPLNLRAARDGLSARSTPTSYSLPPTPAPALDSIAITPGTLTAARNLADGVQPDASAPVSDHLPTAMDIAMHPSLKYGTYVDPAALAVTKTTAAFDVPVAGVGKKAAAWAKAINAASRPPIVEGTAAEDRTALIQHNLRLEQDRRFVVSMCQDQRSHLWVGTEGGGVQCFDPCAPELHQWTKFTSADGLGDDCAYSIACDHLGRIWVGHLNHGISVYNGAHWQNYEPLRGLSSPRSLNGPLGERIFAIKCSQRTGDVWIASNCGLCRYSQTAGNWTYMNEPRSRSAENVLAIAFDRIGKVYCATDCRGLLVASCVNHLTRWERIEGPDVPANQPSGSGLPSNSINDVFVASDDTVYVATNDGLALSTDHGRTWNYVRGKDWLAKVQLSYGHQRMSAPATNRPLLEEDYCTCLAESADNAHQLGSILIGHRSAGFEMASPTFNIFHPSTAPGSFITTLLPLKDIGIVVGSYDYSGTRFFGSKTIGPHATWQTSLKVSPDLPAEAVASNSVFETISIAGESIGGERIAPVPTTVLALEDDWLTEGAWLGRLGRYWACLCAMQAPQDVIWGTGDEKIEYHACLDPRDVPADSLRYWVEWLYTTDQRCLEMPSVYLDSRVRRGLTTTSINRRECEWDDHGEHYPRGRQGPNLFLTVRVPPGRFVLSLYDVNSNGHSSAERLRDYLVSVREHRADKPLDDVSSFDNQVELCRARLCTFYNGVYKRFAVHGPCAIDIRIDRNHSFNTILAGVALDDLDDIPARYGIGTDHCENDNSIEAIDTEYDRVASRMLLRRVSRHGRADNSALLRNLLYRGGFFNSWELSLQAAGRKTVREVEKSLRWDGRTVLGEGVGHQLLAESLRAESNGVH